MTRLWSVFGLLLLALLIVAPLMIWAPVLWIWLSMPLLPLAAWLGWRYAARYFAAYQARWLPDEGVVLSSGVWWRSEVWVPMARLQHLDVSQGPLDRRWGMASLSLHTAGHPRPQDPNPRSAPGASPRPARGLAATTENGART